MGKTDKWQNSPDQMNKKQCHSPTATSSNHEAGEDGGLTLMEEIKNMRSSLQAMISKVAEDASTIKTVITDLQKSVEELTHHVNASETRIAALEDEVISLAQRLDKQDKNAHKLWDRIIDLEGRSRHSNLRIFGIPEGTEPDANNACIFIQNLLQQLFPTSDSTVGVQYELERAHRTLQPRPSAGQKPRAFMIKFVQYKEKKYVLQKAREFRNVQWENNKVEIYQDLPKEVVDRRREFLEIRKKCRENGFRTGFRYLASILITAKGETQRFDDVKEATIFVEEAIKVRK
ncbi:uncharacterized protein LOC106704320 [Latimeria chalumnae]|uniref:uncharacterized protein LOC106704320 n=1 Tax=Latimeria chalumnae TaxID=7897 RepID=UPI0006D8F991|nr:PREDICTED: uncharacterized protein LOC106704320 [Latimeria chalumnae]|eukprot:XP_014346543.1 PREDICTED: uncharacterized protein LOC106704320 [Latimeria chalumnae]